MKRFLLLIIRLYQTALSPLLAPRCRFQPTCSEYFKESLLKHGCSQGFKMGVKRLCKCHPFHQGGFDPVPQEAHAKREC